MLHRETSSEKNQKNKNKNHLCVAGEMARRLGALVALTEELSLFLIPTLRFTIGCNSSSRGSKSPFLTSEGTRQTCGTHTYTHMHAHIYTHMHAHTRCTQIHICTHMHAHTSTHIYTCMHTYLHTCMHIRVHTEMHTPHAHFHTYMHTYVHTQMHTLAHTLIHTHMHPHVHSKM